MSLPARDTLVVNLNVRSCFSLFKLSFGPVVLQSSLGELVKGGISVVITLAESSFDFLTRDFFVKEVEESVDLLLDFVLGQRLFPDLLGFNKRESLIGNKMGRCH